MTTLFRDERDVKAEAIREAAAAQRQLAGDSATRDGRYEHEQLADWLDEYGESTYPQKTCAGCGSPEDLEVTGAGQLLCGRCIDELSNAADTAVRRLAR